MLRKLFFYLVVLTVLSIIAVITAVYFSIEDTALVNVSSNPGQDEIQQVRDIISSNNPADVVSQKKKKLAVTQKQINLLLQYGNQRFVNTLRARTILDNNLAYMKLSYQLPDNPVGRYLNISAMVKIRYAKYFVIEDLKIGKVPVPDFVTSLIQPYIVDRVRKRYASYYALWKIVKRIDIYQKQMTVHYQLKRSDLRNIKKVATNVIINDATKDRIEVYHHEMGVILDLLDPGQQTILNLISPLFAFAESRSLINNQAVEENRIALLTLGAYMVGKNPAQYISDKRVKKLKKITFTLKGRKDLTQHYFVSAALNAVSGTKWSNAIGLQKELKDSDGGSGFSFVDLMADIAGNKLATAALNENKAAIIQKRLKLIGSESEIMGEIGGLLENMTENEFRIEFGTVGSEEYIRVVREIERRLFQCSVYRP